MVKTCCVFKCNNQYDGKARANGISFFRFPKDKRKRKAWIQAVNRKDWLPGDHSWICSEHFLDGWHGDDPDDHNYTPTLFKYKSVPLTPAQKSRETRHEERLVVKVKPHSNTKWKNNRVRHSPLNVGLWQVIGREGSYTPHFEKIK